MPYRSLGKPDLDFSVEQATFIGFFAGMVVPVSEFIETGAGILGVVVFGVVMSVLFRDMKVMLSWAMVIVLTPAFYIVASLWRFARVVSVAPQLMVIYLILLLPGLGEDDVVEFGAIVTAGVVGAMVVGLMLSSPDTLEQDFSIPEVFFMGFPVFGGAYAAALTKLYQDGEMDG